MDALETLYKLAQVAAPGATVRASVEDHGGGSVIRTRTFKVVLTGPNGLAPVSSQGLSPEAATKGLKPLWVAARRRREVDVLYRECCQRAGVDFDTDELARWQDRLGKLYYAAYLDEAGRLKSQATQYQRLAA